MEHDDTPTSVLISSVRFEDHKAILRATDEDAIQWTVTLPVGFGTGAAYWFAQTIKDVTQSTRRAFRITSEYDEIGDHWFTRAGNYGIKSESLSFVEGWDL